MSRIGKKPVPVPKGVEVKIDGGVVSVKGPKTKKPLTYKLPAGIVAKVDGGNVVVTRENDAKKVKALGGDIVVRSLFGLVRALINNMVLGASNGYERSIDIFGNGYGVDVQGRVLVLNVGFCHSVKLNIPEGVDIDLKIKQTRGDLEPARFIVKGPDKQAVGEFAAQVRRVKPPEPYKGKGIRYTTENVRRKEGKPLVSAGG